MLTLASGLSYLLTNNPHTQTHTHTHTLSLSLSLSFSVSPGLEVRGTHHTLRPEWAPAMPTISWEVWVVFLSPKWLPRL